jgi:hypothetical protein
MNGKQRSLRRWDVMIGFSLVAVLLSALVCADPAVAQCGPSTTVLQKRSIGIYWQAVAVGAMR